MKKIANKYNSLLVFIILSFIPFGISLGILIKSGIDKEIAIYWFIVGIAFLSFPFISELRFKDIEIKIKDAISNNLEDITKRLDEIAPRRFANLIYLIARNRKVALIVHEFHKKKCLLVRGLGTMKNLMMLYCKCSKTS